MRRWRGLILHMGRSNLMQLMWYCSRLGLRWCGGNHTGKMTVKLVCCSSYGGRWTSLTLCDTPMGIPLLSGLETIDMKSETTLAMVGKPSIYV